MDKPNDIDELRRRFLVRILASGAFAVTGNLVSMRPAGAESFSKTPGPLPAGRSIYELRGDVLVNGSAASLETFIGTGDKVQTGENSFIIFVVGKDAFILRSNSVLEIGADKESGLSEEIKRITVNTLRVVTGKLLSVFGKQRHTIQTPTAVIGIRGTGVYVESVPDESYVCTCYGTTNITSANDPRISETIVSTHHSAPRYVLAESKRGNIIRPAPFKNHSDEELLLIETLVGRTTPFVVPGGLRNYQRRYF